MEIKSKQIWYIRVEVVVWLSLRPIKIKTIRWSFEYRDLDTHDVCQIIETLASSNILKAYPRDDGHV